jgi:hypothetical protein
MLSENAGQSSSLRDIADIELTIGPVKEAGRCTFVTQIHCVSV